MKKLYVVTKYIEARSPAEAIRIEGEYPAEEVYIETDFRKNNLPEISRQRTIGYRT